jgi:hypothetical protein
LYVRVLPVSKRIKENQKLSYHVSPLGDTTAPVGPLEGWVTLDEGKANLLQDKGQTFRLPIIEQAMFKLFKVQTS